MAPMSKESSVAEKSISKPPAPLFHLTEIAEWTPELANKLANIRPLPLGSAEVFFSLPTDSPYKFRSGK